MKYPFIAGPAFLVAVLAASAGPAPAPVAFDSFAYTGRDTLFTAPVPASHYQNPILAGFYPDPSICRVPDKSGSGADDYYLINSTFSYFPGIPIFHSRDLTHWTQIGHVISRPTQLNYDGLGVTRGLFAPAISHHNGTFYVVCTLVDGGGNFLVTAKDPAGPWSDPIWLGFDGIDPSLFFDDNGRAWLVNNGNPPDNQPQYEGHRAIWLQEFDPATNQLIGPRSIIVNGGADLSKKPVWIEGPHLFRHGEWYYLCCAEGGTSENHSQVILRSPSPTGPFQPWADNPILTQRDLDGTAPLAITCTGHADLTEGPGGQWWAVFLACRPYAGKFYATGRETFLLPVTWTTDGWPRILPHGERVPMVVPAPMRETPATRATLQEQTGKTESQGNPDLKPSVLSVASSQNSSVPLTGNFTWRDDFTSPTLSPLWIMVRTPKETWWHLDSAAGQLSLTPRTDPLSGTGNPSFLARRLQHSRFDATTSLAVPATAGTSAGLVLFQSETHYFYLAVRRTAGGLALLLERDNGGTPEIIATAPLAADTAQLQLRITGEETKLAFAYASATAAAGAWQALAADVDAMPITVQSIGLHFTGAVIGLHARVDP